MLKVSVCVGNACILKGSSLIIKAFKEMITKYHLEERVELLESYCQGHCRRGASIKIGDEYIVSINQLNAEETFREYILGGGFKPGEPIKL